MSEVESAIEQACDLATTWFQSLTTFPKRVNLGSVVGGRHPALLSEGDCVMQFARFLNEAGIAWESIHHQLAASRWLFDAPHPGAGSRWAADLAIINSESFAAAVLPATTVGFQFDACLEFKYLSDFWTLPKVNPYGQPRKAIAAVQADATKIGQYLAHGICRSGYVVVFEETNSGFPENFASDAEAETGSRVRFIHGWP